LVDRTAAIGRGGDVVVEAVNGLIGLIHYHYQQHFKAKRGGKGMARTTPAGEGLTPSSNRPLVDAGAPTRGRLVQRRIRPPHVIACSLWGRAHQPL
jgi:hypothetical protein